jgi:2-polyprenyl-6-methoxyphenol hydroxylase-like FAD-dependent oxidoreductase
MLHSCDVIIVGAGPAGASAARALAARGRHAVVFEREAPGRDKPCGEGVQGPGLAMLERTGLGARVREQGFAFDAVELEAGTARLRLPLAGLAIRRTRLDRLLAEAAARAGAEFRWGGAPQRLARCGGEWQLEAGRETWRAPWIVGADGAGSWVRRRLGVASVAARGRAGWVAHVPCEPRPRRAVAIFAVAGGEVYTVAVGRGERLVAWLGPAGALAGSRRVALAAAVNAALDARGLCAAFGHGRTYAPLESRAARAAGHGWLLAGDAAGQSDPAAGLGISWALATGEAAGAALALALTAADPRAAYAFARRSRRRLAAATVFARCLRALAHRPALWPGAAALLRGAPELPAALVASLFPRHTELNHAMPDVRPFLPRHP